MAHLLLDTCAAIWIVEREPLSRLALDRITDSIYEGVPLRVSPITAWERGQLVAKGRMTSPLDPKTWFRNLVNDENIIVVDLTADILSDSSFLPQPVHGDPADRIIIATARTHDLTIVTRDRRILDYAAHGHVRAIAC